MASTLEYALLAGDAYFDTRDAINRFPTPYGWTASDRQARDNGFEAVTFTNASTNEIVISFAGTDPDDTFGDQTANFGLAGERVRLGILHKDVDRDLRRGHFQQRHGEGVSVLPGAEDHA